MSRFKDLSLEDFIQIMVKCGFQLKWKDTSNDYFYLMDFKKVKEMKSKVSDFSLKPCVYKKRWNHNIRQFHEIHLFLRNPNHSSNSQHTSNSWKSLFFTNFKWFFKFTTFMKFTIFTKFTTFAKFMKFIKATFLGNSQFSWNSPFLQKSRGGH